MKNKGTTHSRSTREPPKYKVFLSDHKQNEPGTNLFNEVQV